MNLSVARHVKEVVRDAEGLPVRHLVLRLLLGPSVVLFNSLQIQLFIIVIGVGVHTLVLFRPTVLLAPEALLVLLCHEASDVEPLARHDGHVRRGHHVVVMQVPLLLILLLILMTVGLERHISGV